MNNEISKETFEKILNAVDKLNREEYEAIINGDVEKAEKINKKISRRLNILIVPDSKFTKYRK